MKLLKSSFISQELTSSQGNILVLDEELLKLLVW